MGFRATIVTWVLSHWGTWRYPFDPIWNATRNPGIRKPATSTQIVNFQKPEGSTFSGLFTSLHHRPHQLLSSMPLSPRCAHCNPHRPGTVEQSYEAQASFHKSLIIWAPVPGPSWDGDPLRLILQTMQVSMPKDQKICCFNDVPKLLPAESARTGILDHMVEQTSVLVSLVVTLETEIRQLRSWPLHQRSICSVRGHTKELH